MSDSTAWVSGAITGMIALLALWRSGRVRVLDRRTELRKECAALRLALDNLAAGIPRAVGARARITAMNGQAGALQHFRNEADADSATVAQLRAQVASTEPVRLLAGYSTVETKLVRAHELGLRVKALQEKYARAAAEDEEQRRRRHQEILAHVSRAG